MVVRQNTSDRERPAVYDERLTDNVGIGCEACLPEPLAQDDDAAVARLYGPPYSHRHADDLEKVGRDTHNLEPVSIAAQAPVRFRCFVAARESIEDVCIAQEPVMWHVDVAGAADAEIRERLRISARGLAEQE